MSSTNDSSASVGGAATWLPRAEVGTDRFDFAYNGASFRNSTIAEALAWGIPDSALLSVVKAMLTDRVDASAEALRLTLITPGSGQAMEYQEAYAEAVQVDAATKAGQTVDAKSFPMLSASIGYDIDPQTKQPTTDVIGEARSVLAAYDAYQKAGAAIRGARLDAKKKIGDANTTVAASAAFDAIVWPAF